MVKIIVALIILRLAWEILYKNYLLKTKDIGYEYKANKMDQMEADYENQVQTLQSTVEELHKLAFTHTVTKIGNIDYFHERCTFMFHRYTNAKFAMVGLSISNMGKINQIFGPGEGDKVMAYTADILKSGLLMGCVYAHVSSNLLGILFRDTKDDDIISIIDTITERLAKYSSIVAVTATFGIYKFDSHHTSDSLMDIMNNTLLAQKAIKDESRCNYAFFTEELARTSSENRQMSMEMEAALDEHKFIVYLQPMISLHSYKIVSAEALVRWDYPGKGLLSPYAFLPLFEDSTLMQKLDYYMWEECCKLVRRWIDNKMDPVPVCMNVSPIHFQSTAFIDTLEKFMDQYLISKDFLILELPERGIANASDETAQIINTLKERGFSLCIDNFGSVHSPLNLLKDYPIERIKLD
ncbi:MAG: EAL domain-containing protein, partial [Oscillospiraceae bacterium]|nr:EAL domain-containing protein [Oscillospiraceae bacterium]